MKIAVDRQRCMRSAQCSYMHPDLFREGADGFPVVVVEHPVGEQLEEAEDARDICPAQAIALTDDGSGTD